MTPLFSTNISSQELWDWRDISIILCLPLSDLNICNIERQGDEPNPQGVKGKEDGRK